jgi:hypothetical protein
VKYSPALKKISFTYTVSSEGICIHFWYKSSQMAALTDVVSTAIPLAAQRKSFLQKWRRDERKLCKTFKMALSTHVNSPAV